MVFIRLFHALFSLSEPLDLSVRGRQAETGLVFGDITGYAPCSPGYLQVTASGSRTKTVYLQKTLPFFSPEAFTLAVIPGSMGMDLLQIPDYTCFSPSPGSGCVRTVNLTDDPCCYYLCLYGGRLLFADVSFRHITCQKLLTEGKHGVYLTLPLHRAPLIPSVFPLEGGESCTCYVYGSMSQDSLSLVKLRDTPQAGPLKDLPG